MKIPIKKKNRKYLQGIFNPLHPEKYKGTSPIIYRSSLELKCFRWMDNNSNILTWGSESVIIPYTSPLDGKIHRYFVDIVSLLKDKDGNLKKLLIEIKPSKFTIKPTLSERKSSKTIIYEQTQYAVNQAKWQAAQQYCTKNNYTFIILTEKDLIGG
jgi:hypothetical protein